MQEQDAPRKAKAENCLTTRVSTEWLPDFSSNQVENLLSDSMLEFGTVSNPVATVTSLGMNSCNSGVWHLWAIVQLKCKTNPSIVPYFHPHHWSVWHGCIQFGRRWRHQILNPMNPKRLVVHLDPTLEDKKDKKKLYETFVWLAWWTDIKFLLREWDPHVRELLTEDLDPKRVNILTKWL